MKQRLHRFCRLVVLAASEHGMNARQQYFGFDRLGNVVVGSGV